MNVMRTALLAGARSTWLRRHATRTRFVRRAVSRFMPGETLEDGLAAARALAPLGIGVVLTHLGENVADRGEAEAVVGHYVEVLDRVRSSGLDAEVSVKLTQLGLDLDRSLACANTARLASHAGEFGIRLWIDMESTPYTDATLEIYRTLRPAHSNLGVCLQSYLRRTRDDLESLLPLGPRVRMVKGAYDEPAQLAFTRKREVDENLFALSRRLLEADARQAGAWLTVGTHDLDLIRRLEAHAASAGIPSDAFEFTLLFGIQRGEQERLARAGYRTRVLISYGSYWFPWYMRRLAERPANVMFIARNLFAR